MQGARGRAHALGHAVGAGQDEVEALEVDLVGRDVSTQVREGLLLDLLGRIRHEDARERTVRAMAARYNVDEAQAQRVAQTACLLLEEMESLQSAVDQLKGLNTGRLRISSARRQSKKLATPTNWMARTAGMFRELPSASRSLIGP